MMISLVTTGTWVAVLFIEKMLKYHSTNYETFYQLDLEFLSGGGSAAGFFKQMNNQNMVCTQPRDPEINV